MERPAVSLTGNVIFIGSAENLKLTRDGRFRWKMIPMGCLRCAFLFQLSRPKRHIQKRGAEAPRSI
jgi:hypothetical protein